MKKPEIGTVGKKVAISLLVIVIGVLAYTSVINKMLDKTAIKKIDEKSSRYLDNAFKRAIYTYAIVRGINGIISVIQNTHIAVSPAGLGVNVAVGEILDPVNDLIERFSWVMLVSTTSLGIQKIFMKIGAWLGLNILLSAAMLMLLIGIWVPENFIINFRSWGYKLIIVSIMIRFCIPAVSIASDKLYDLFLKDSFEEATQSLDKLNQDLKKTDIVKDDRNINKKENGVLGNIKKYYRDTKETLKINERIQLLKRRLADYAKDTINLIIVFILQTVIIPIFVLWVFLKFTGFIALRDIDFRRKKQELLKA
jgi:hypothetical protein